jgi:RNA polymerase-binding protein DksA
MATTRSKRPTRSKTSRPGPKSRPRAGRPAPRKAAKPAARPAARATKPAKLGKGAAAKAPPKGAKPMPKGAKPMPKGAKPAPKGAKAGKAQPVATKPMKPAAKPAPPVKPLGVLPPESRVRSMERLAPPVARPRPTTPTATSTATQGVQRVTERDMKYFEERLITERQKILKDMGHLETTVLKVNQRDSSGDLSGYSFHMADAGTDAMEREKAFMFASAEGRMLMEIDDALRRLYKGEYGMCEICGNPIARARLEAMPHARLCVSCKEKEERANRVQGQTQGPGNANP